MSNTTLTVGTLLASAGAPFLFVVLAWGNDMVFSKRTSEAITDSIKNVTEDPARSPWSADIARMLNEYFPPEWTAARLWIHVLAISLVSMASVLAVYCARMPDLVPQLMSAGFLRQFLFDGLVKVVLVNAFAFRYSHELIDVVVPRSLTRNLAWLLADAFCKALIFIALTTLIYVCFALTAGAFGGSALSAAQSVPVTIREALQLRNLTGVYVYSLPLSAFPIYLAVVVRLMVLNPGFARTVHKIIFFLPIAEKPIRAAAIVFFIFASLFATAMAILVSWPSSAITR